MEIRVQRLERALTNFFPGSSGSDTVLRRIDEIETSLLNAGEEVQAFLKACMSVALRCRSGGLSVNALCLSLPQIPISVIY